eukprot:GHRQ01034093.1.p1 GENE.GHRQ01034093.1~~GHRQ01034093.1.p1  ORF type:complete len:109 (-),score=6.15 GHRQ01034093.1:164-490(-)
MHLAQHLSQLVQLRDEAHSQALIQRAAHKQPLLVWAPVKAVDGLRGQAALRQLLHAACHAQLLAILVLQAYAVNTRLAQSLHETIKSWHHKLFAVTDRCHNADRTASY